MTTIEDYKRRIEIKRQLIEITQDDIAVLRGLIEEEKIKKGAGKAPLSD